MREMSINGRAMSIMGELPSVRMDLVQAMARRVNNPSYDVDAELAEALEIMLKSREPVADKE